MDAVPRRRHPLALAVRTMAAALRDTGAATPALTLAVTLTVTLLAALAAPAAPADAEPPYAPTASPAARPVQPASATRETPHTSPVRRRVELGGVDVRLWPGTRQVVTVNARAGWHAGVALWRRTEQHGWQRVTRARDGRTGYGGLVPARQRRQGTGTTPLGTFRVTETFGLADEPGGSRMPFHRVRAGDYWVQDNASAYYNQLRNKRQGGFRWRASGYNSSERLRDYRGQYRWSVVIDFNRPRPVRHRGSGIFLHVNGAGATGGCVSTPRGFVRQTMRRLQPQLHPVVAIGR
ncbi:MAG: secreted protein [Nocardioidaceae bacterium]|nr:secreted protein [Nocardioidaceae bacterium]